MEIKVLIKYILLSSHCSKMVLITGQHTTHRDLGSDHIITVSSIADRWILLFCGLWGLVDFYWVYISPSFSGCTGYGDVGKVMHNIKTQSNITLKSNEWIAYPFNHKSVWLLITHYCLVSKQTSKILAHMDIRYKIKIAQTVSSSNQSNINDQYSRSIIWQILIRLIYYKCSFINIFILLFVSTNIRYSK